MAEFIDHARCPLCGSKRARLTLSKAKLPTLTCNACQCQIFARSENSDEHLRKMIVKDEPAPAPAAKPEPAPATAKPEPAPAAKSTEQKPAPKSADRWDVFA